jgi:transcriptional regulator GlxA family with amidase domain
LSIFRRYWYGQIFFTAKAFPASYRPGRLAENDFMVVSLHGSSTQRAQKKLRRIGFLGFEGVRTLDLTGPLEAFAAARNTDREGNRQSCYETVVVGLTRKSFVSQSGVTFKAQTTIQAVTNLDTIIIPGGHGLHIDKTLGTISGWLLTQAPHVRRIAAVCGGIYPLAQSGLLNGRLVTTHWRLAPDVARQFPQLHLKADAAFLKDDAFYTCGGGSAAIEMSLSLINEDYGSQVALALARELVVRLRPPGAEDHIDATLYESGPMERLAELPSWIVAHIDDNLSIEILARRACFCPRHFSRVFKSVFKCTPADFVERLRVKEAGRRLLTSRHSVESIAAAVGYASSDAFRRAFERRLGVTPTRYRRQPYSNNIGAPLSQAVPSES